MQSNKEHRIIRQNKKRVCKICGGSAVAKTGFCKRHIPEGFKGSVCRACGAKAHGGLGYCLGHLPDEMRCVQITKKGKRCSLPRVPGSDTCKTHLDVLRSGSGSGKYGWVYVYDTMQDISGKRVYKIGRTKNIKQREGEFITCNPLGKMLFAGFYGVHAKYAESVMHQEFQSQWLRHELFCLDRIELGLLRRLLASDATGWWLNSG